MKAGTLRPGSTPASRLRLWPLLAALLGHPTAAAAAADDALWTDALKPAYFGDRPIVESEEILSLDAPERAADPAFVPISITAKLPQAPQRYIEHVYLIIDKNPGPLVGTFHFTPRSGRADLELRVRVNEYSMIRAVAETNDGGLYMTKRFVKASGGCAAPISTDLESALARLGRTKMNVRDSAGSQSPALVQLMVSHPNTTGMQMDQLTGLYSPAQFVTRVEVSFEGEPVFSADTSFAVSENPNFRFYFVPMRSGELTAEIIDSNGLRFEHRYGLTAAGAAGGAPEPTPED